MPAIPRGLIRLAILFWVAIAFPTDGRCGETVRRGSGHSVPVRVANLSDQPNRDAGNRAPAAAQEFGAQTAPVRSTVRDDLPLPIIATNAAVPQQCDHCCSVCDPFHRAGHPEQVSWLAVMSNNCRYGGYYVGGGLPLRGEQRCEFHEGTWGWDYFGVLFSKKVPLHWGHGRRPQGGAGAYKTDGPKLRHE